MCRRICNGLLLPVIAWLNKEINDLQLGPSRGLNQSLMAGNLSNQSGATMSISGMSIHETFGGADTADLQAPSALAAASMSKSSPFSFRPSEPSGMGAYGASGGVTSAHSLSRGEADLSDHLGGGSIGLDRMDTRESDHWSGMTSSRGGDQGGSWAPGRGVGMAVLSTT